MHRIQRTSSPWIVAILTAGCLMVAGNLHAQTWQSLFGGLGVETGRGGVQPLAGGGGYISVGTTPSFGPNNDVYVVQENLAGGIVWAFAYDFGGQDYGLDIQELAGGGFIITGKTDVNGGVDDLFLLNINAAGAVVWASTFGGPAIEAGRDVIETANGDIVAVGESYAFGPLNQDGLIVRTNPAGVPIFVDTYGPPAGGLNEDLRGLFEAANGDLLVCGATTSFGMGTQAWLMRTTAAGLVLWSTHTGGPAIEEFNSVIELAVGVNAGQILAAGATTGPAPQDFYLAKYTAGGVMIVPDISGGGAMSADEVFQIRELQIGAAPGNILLVGHMNPGPLGGDDGYVVNMTPVWQCPNLGKNWSSVYGGNGADQLYSGVDVAVNCYPGFILCGFSASPNLLAPGDVQQHYVIKTDIVGISGCNEIRPGDRCTQPNYPVVAAPMLATPWPWGVPHAVLQIPAMVTQNLCFRACPPPAPHRQDPVERGIAAIQSGAWVETGIAPALTVHTPGNGVASAPDVLATIAVSAVPNPVAAGNTFQVRYTLGQAMPIGVVVSDMSGTVVYRRAPENASGNGSIGISTAGWPAGSYMVRTDLGNETRIERIVVVGK